MSNLLNYLTDSPSNEAFYQTQIEEKCPDVEKFVLLKLLEGLSYTKIFPLAQKEQLLINLRKATKTRWKLTKNGHPKTFYKDFKVLAFDSPHGVIGGHTFTVFCDGEEIDRISEIDLDVLPQELDLVIENYLGKLQTSDGRKELYGH